MSDSVSEIGISVPTEWNVNGSWPGALPLLGRASGSRTGQGEWEKVTIAHPEFRRASNRVELYEGKGNVTLGSGVAQWARLRPQDPEGGIENWTMESVALISDILPTALGRLERAVQEKAGKPTPVWFPTLALNIDFKRFTLGHSNEWLYSHIHTKSVKNGRMDVEIVILDAAGDLVAVATQAALVMSSERNTAQKSEAGRSKL